MSKSIISAMPTMDLILDPEEIEQFNTLVDSFGDDFESKIESYNSILTTLCNDAVKDGELHKKLEIFSQEAAKCKDQMKAICNEIVKKTNGMKDDVDRIDEDFYKNGDIY